MRTIKFRGKDYGDKWWYGYVAFITATSAAIIHPENYIGVTIYVYPDTVGQFTGLTDKNGKEIYEGDIIKEDNLIHQILWIDDASCFCRCNLQDADIRIRISRDEMRYVEVIGNIHDNPELLKGGKK